LIAGALPVLATGFPVRRREGPHPAPRPGVDASHVLRAEDLTDTPDAVPVFDLVREIPRIADGIRCQCGCDQIPDMYSLLSCYEGDGMARHCQICQGVAKLAHRLHRQGRTLNEIRAAVDAESWG
jgi:hypothetical protein